MSRIKIKYGDFSEAAKENLIAGTDDVADFVDLSQLNKNILSFPNYENPIEGYSVDLSGEAVPLPSKKGIGNIGYWSDSLASANQMFQYPILLSMESEKTYSSSGVSFVFDQYAGVYPSGINIRWYRKEDDGVITELGNENFFPTGTVFFCKNKVESFNLVEISFYTLNAPMNRLKIRSINFGFGVIFSPESISDIKIMQEIDPISSNISINNASVSLVGSFLKDYTFQQGQQMEVYFNENLLQKAFIKKRKRKSVNEYNIDLEDYIDVMDSIAYGGGLWASNLSPVNAKSLLEHIFSVAGVPFEIDPYFDDVEIFGYIPYTTCREALLQVAFAIQAVVDTSNSDVVRVYHVDLETTSKSVAKNRILQGQSISDVDVISSLSITTHDYFLPTEIEDEILYSAEKSGVGENIFIQFSEPFHSLHIESGDILDRGEVLDSVGANYVIINAREGCKLYGGKFDYSSIVVEKKNPQFVSTEEQNIKSITDATMVSLNNVDNVIDSCYNYLVKPTEVQSRIVVRNEDENVSSGDIVSVETADFGSINGIIIRQSFNLNGGIIVKDSSMVGG